jgi:hypothetical protein
MAWCPVDTENTAHPKQFSRAVDATLKQGLTAVARAPVARTSEKQVEKRKVKAEARALKRQRKVEDQEEERRFHGEREHIPFGEVAQGLHGRSFV